MLCFISPWELRMFFGRHFLDFWANEIEPGCWGMRKYISGSQKCQRMLKSELHIEGPLRWDFKPHGMLQGVGFLKSGPAEEDLYQSQGFAGCLDTWPQEMSFCEVSKSQRPYTYLGGGFKYVYFYPYLGRWSNFRWVESYDTFYMLSPFELETAWSVSKYGISFVCQKSVVYPSFLAAMAAKSLWSKDCCDQYAGLDGGAFPTREKGTFFRSQTFGEMLQGKCCWEFWICIDKRVYRQIDIERRHVLPKWVYIHLNPETLERLSTNLLFIHKFTCYFNTNWWISCE